MTKIWIILLALASQPSFAKKFYRFGFESVTGSENIFNYRNASTGRFNGIEIELIAQIATELDGEIAYEMVKWDRLENALKEKRIDFAIQQIFKEPTDKDLEFSKNYFRSGVALAFSKSKAIANSAMKTLPSSSGAIFVDPRASKCLSEHNFKKFSRKDSESELYDILEKGLVSYIAYDFPLLVYRYSGNKNIVVDSKILSCPGNYGVLFRSDFANKAKIDKAIDSWRLRTDIKKIISKYELPIQ